MLQGWLQIILFLAVLLALTPLIGGYMARVYGNERVFLDPGPRTARAALLPRHARGHRPRPGLEGLRAQPARLLAACSGSRCT